LAHKQLKCDYLAVNLLENEQNAPDHLLRNPLGTVPVLKTEDGAYISESTVIIEWLDETQTGPKVVGDSPEERVQIRRLSQIINSGIQPIQNLKVLKYLDEVEVDRKEWARHWISEGLLAYQKLAKSSAGRFSVGDKLTMADFCLIPQLYNARRFEVNVEELFPELNDIEQAVAETEVFEVSHPDRFKPA